MESVPSGSWSMAYVCRTEPDKDVSRSTTCRVRAQERQDGTEEDDRMKDKPCVSDMLRNSEG